MAERYQYLVRTLFLANYVEAATRVAKERRNPTGKDGLINALKRLDFADRMLERELNAYGLEGYQLVDAIHHVLTDQPNHLLVTAVFIRSLPDDDTHAAGDLPQSPLPLP